MGDWLTVARRGDAMASGPVAQRLEQATHNRLVVGSNPSRPSHRNHSHSIAIGYDGASSAQASALVC